MTCHPSPLHARLRSATRDAHHRLDHHPMLAPLVRAGLPAVHYAKVLGVFHSLYAPLDEAILDGLGARALGFDYRPRRKAPTLAADLSALGAPLPAPQRDLPALDSAASLVGVLYAIEGSTLGGRVIAREIGRHSGGALPTAFFSSYGAQTDERWCEFWRFAEHCCPDEADAAAEAAARFFARVAQLFDHAPTICSETLT